jgi:hypothetical protein
MVASSVIASQTLARTQSYVGAPLPVETNNADQCWIFESDEVSCFLEVAKLLLEVYLLHELD